MISLSLVILVCVHLVLGVAETSDENPCPELWVQGTWVGLGCLLFNTTQKYTWEGALAYCQNEDSNLVEIQFQEQLDFLIMELDVLADHEGSEYEWWTAGTDLGKEGRWMWQGSLSPVPQFLWYSSHPNDNNEHNCLMLESGWNYAALDYDCQYTAMPICQKHMI